MSLSKRGFFEGLPYIAADDYVISGLLYQLPCYDLMIVEYLKRRFRRAIIWGGYEI